MHIKGWQKSLSRLTLTLIATDSWQIWTLVCKESFQNLNFWLDIFSGRIPYLWQIPCIYLCQIPLKTKFGRLLYNYGQFYRLWNLSTGKWLSEALIFALIYPQYDNRLFFESPVQYMKMLSSNLGRTCCVQKLFLTFRTIYVHNVFSPCSAERRASDKDLPHR